METSPWIYALGVLLVALLLGLLARLIIVGRLEALFRRTPTDLDDIAIAASRRWIPVWFLLGGVQIAARIAPIPPSLADLAGRGDAVEADQLPPRPVQLEQADLVPGIQHGPGGEIASADSGRKPRRPPCPVASVRFGGRHAGRTATREPAVYGESDPVAWS